MLGLLRGSRVQTIQALVARDCSRPVCVSLGPAPLLSPKATPLIECRAATLSLGTAALWNLADRYDRMTPDVYADPSIAVLMYTWVSLSLICIPASYGDSS